jgi:hypothetical protein
VPTPTPPTAWLKTTMTGCILLAWLKLIALGGPETTASGSYQPS